MNPVIEAVEGEQEEDEGCLSLPGLWYPVRRAQYARVRGVNRLGQPVVVEGEGLLARCIQHGVYHLNGQLFVDRLSGSVRKHAMRDLRESYISGESLVARALAGNPSWHQVSSATRLTCVRPARDTCGIVRESP